MVELLLYRVRCETEDNYQFVWQPSTDPVPTECPNDVAHTIDESLTTVVDKKTIAEEAFFGDYPDYNAAAIAVVNEVQYVRTVIEDTDYDKIRMVLVDPKTGGTAHVAVFDDSAIKSIGDKITEGSLTFTGSQPIGDLEIALDALVSGPKTVHVAVQLTSDSPLLVATLGDLGDEAGVRFEQALSAGIPDVPSPEGGRASIFFAALKRAE